MELAAQALFADELRRLHVAAGRPSYTRLSGRSRIPRSTIGDLLTGRFVRAPRWETVCAVVRACVEESVRTEADRVPPEVLSRGDERWWRRRHGELVDALNTANAIVGGSVSEAPRTQDDQSGMSPSAHIVVGDIPREPAEFHVRGHLLGQLAEPSLCVLTGGRGVGKTQLAAAYARHRIADGWAVVAWIDARTEGLVIAGWESVANGLGLRHENTARAAVTCLERLDGPSLVVFDNADDPDLLRGWLPRCGRTQVVVTTLVRAVEDLGTTIEVGLFSDDEAAAFLRARTSLPDDGAPALIAELDRLPLALAHAGAVIRRQRIPYATYLERLRAFPIERYLPRHPGDPYPLSTAQAILLSTAVAENADDTGLTWALLAVVSTMPTASRQVLHAVAAATMATPTDAADVDAALGTLAENSILTFSLDGEAVAMHRVTARVVRDQETQRGHIEGIVLAACQGLEALTDQGDWPERARAERLVDQIDMLRDTCRGHDLPGDIVQRVLALRRWAAGYLFHTAEPSRAVAACTTLVTDYQDMLGYDRTRIFPLTTTLASAYLRAGQFDEAIELLTEQLAVADTLGLDEDLARSNLAGALARAGRIDDAVSLHEQTLRRRTLRFGEHDPRTLSAALKLASGYDAADQPERGIALLAPIAAVSISLLGADHPLTLAARETLANLYLSADRFTEAVTLLTAAIADCRRARPDDTVSLVGVCRHLVRAYARAQHFDDAVALCESLERETSSSHPTNLALRYDRAELYLVTGRRTDAVDAFAALVAESELTLGPEHPNTVHCRSMLAHASHR